MQVDAETRMDFRENPELEAVGFVGQIGKNEDRKTRGPWLTYGL